MSARHQAMTDQQHARLAHLRYMTGTGSGITRIPLLNKFGNVVVRVDQPGVNILHTEPDLFAGPDVFTSLGHTHSNRPGRTVMPALVSAVTQISIDHYRSLCREKQELDETLKQYVRGHTWFTPHVSPFGADRFHTFDPTPAHELIRGQGNAVFNRIYC